MNGSLFEYYRKKEDENRNIIFEIVKEEDIKICGHTIEEVITILNGLEVERLTGIILTIENVQSLFNRVIEEMRGKKDE